MRQRAGLTRPQSALRVRIERGEHRVTVIDLIEIAEAIGFDPMAAVRRVVKAGRPDDPGEA